MRPPQHVWFTKPQGPVASTSVPAEPLDPPDGLAPEAPDPAAPLLFDGASLWPQPTTRKVNASAPLARTVPCRMLRQQ